MNAPDPIDRKRIQGVSIFAQTYDGKRVLVLRQEHLCVRVPITSGRRLVDALHEYLDGQPDA